MSPYPPDLWAIFKEICAIPHESGAEGPLANRLGTIAREYGLAVRTDAAGNLCIDRSGAPERPCLIFQAHLDMVWQSPEEVPRLERRVQCQVKNGWLTAAPASSLGADNGIGVAAALAILLDPPGVAPPLRAIFTVEEETGLIGAAKLAPEWLAGGRLLNLDTENEQEIIIGCAGGVHTSIALPISSEETPPGLVGMEIVLDGFPGGHSGIDIDKDRPNAILELVKTLERMPDFRIAHITTEGPGNAIPRRSCVLGAVPETTFGALPCCRRVKTPPRVWKMETQKRVLDAVRTMPNGVLSLDPIYRIPGMSSNLAAISNTEDTLTLLTSQRGMSDYERDEATRRVQAHFAGLSPRFDIGAFYSAWEPVAHSSFPDELRRVYRTLFDKDPELRVIHAGLECGLLSRLNPSLPMASIGPTIEFPHSPSERLDVASAARFYRFLRAIVEHWA